MLARTVCICSLHRLCCCLVGCIHFLWPSTVFLVFMQIEFVIVSIVLVFLGVRI